MTKLRVLSLFAGIGGFDLGLERTGGFETVAFCEIDPFCRRVLAKHWPEVPCYHDVRELTAERLAADGIAADVICGGFPCQDISSAGKQAGIAGERSGLWSEFARTIGELRPSYVIVENVADLLHRGLSIVLGNLASLGYDAEWHCISAAYVGAPHRRDRIWIVAHPYADSWGQQKHQELDRKALPHAADRNPRRRHADRLCDSVAHPPRQLLDRAWAARARRRSEFANGRWWETEPSVGRVADGVSGRTHRLKALGNAVVPQIPELIGRALLAAIADTHPKGEDVEQASSLMSGGGAAGNRPRKVA